MNVIRCKVALIGDPRGKGERVLESFETINANYIKLKAQVERLFGCETVNNYDWIKDINTIDFLRGCACIFIILIHTAWWSGQKYLPSWFSNLFLLVDVPIFVFLSGLSYNYFESIGKNIKGILKQWNKWVFFLIFYSLISVLFC